MNLEKLYKLQSELDNHILENARERNIVMSEEELLDKTILALLVEVGELANATRCFKHWSLKKSESKERLLDELADIWHFFLSIGNQIHHKLFKRFIISDEEYRFLVGSSDISSEKIFIKLYEGASLLGTSLDKEEKTAFYDGVGMSINVLGRFLGFTDEEVEQAYLKKHEENYRRQREGY